MNQPEVEKSSWFPELSFDRVLTMIGIGFAAWNIFGKTRDTFRFERPPVKNYVSEQKDPDAGCTSTDAGTEHHRVLSLEWINQLKDLIGKTKIRCRRKTKW